MDSSNRSGLGIEVLNQSNYKVWRTCMEFYLIGEDLWDVVNEIIQLLPRTSKEMLMHSKDWSSWMQKRSSCWSDRFLTACSITSCGAIQPMKFGGLLTDSSIRRMKHDFRFWRMSLLTPRRVISPFLCIFLKLKIFVRIFPC